MDARKLKEQGKKFDKILVDAPCSGEGMIYMNNLNNNAENRFVVSDKDIKWCIN